LERGKGVAHWSKVERKELEGRVKKLWEEWLVAERVFWSLVE
jgi:hypothetical protein